MKNLFTDNQRQTNLKQQLKMMKKQDNKVITVQPWWVPSFLRTTATTPINTNQDTSFLRECYKEYPESKHSVQDPV